MADKLSKFNIKGTLADVIDREARSGLESQSESISEMQSEIEAFNVATSEIDDISSSLSEASSEIDDITSSLSELGSEVDEKLAIETGSEVFSGNIDEITHVWDVKWIYASSATGTLPTTSFQLITIRNVQFAIPLSASDTVGLYIRFYASGNWQAWRTINKD